MEVKAFVKTVADRVAEVMAKTISDTLGHVGPSQWARNFVTRYQR